MQDHQSVTSTQPTVWAGLRIHRDLAGKYGALFVLILLIGLNITFTPNFANVNTIWNILIQVSSVLLVALGMTIVVSSGGIDISVGSIMAISSIVTAKALGLGVVPAIAAGLVTVALFGAFSGFMIGKFKIQPIIVTLTLMISGRGIAQVINDAQLLNFTEPSFSFFGTHRLFGIIPIQVLIMAIAVAVVYFVMNRMTFGLYVQAIGVNSKA
jgi:ribose/xylose/arabinose/galactoside ABC-type transport system permease subunit